MIMKKMYILLSYVFNNYWKTCKSLEMPSLSNDIFYLFKDTVYLYYEPIFVVLRNL